MFLQVPRGMEIIILAIIVIVIIFGARKIPEIARAMGRAGGEFKKGQQDAQRELATEAEKPSEERHKLEAAAKALGIDVAGKNETQIREEMRRKLGESSV